MNHQQSIFHESIGLLYQLGKNVYRENLPLSKTCLLGALHGQLVKMGVLPPDLDPSMNASFDFMDQIVLTLNWNDLLEKVKVDHYSNCDRLLLLSTLNLLESCYGSMQQPKLEKKGYKEHFLNLHMALQDN